MCLSLCELIRVYMLKQSKSERLLSALTHQATTACNVGALPSNNGVNVQRVNFNYLGATALERLGRFYNVPEAHYGCPLDELAYAVATAFMREVPSPALAPLICIQVLVALFSGLLCCRRQAIACPTQSFRAFVFTAQQRCCGGNLQVCGWLQRDADERKVAMKLAKMVEGRRLQAELDWQSDPGASGGQ